jgi:hypothetical protein
MSSLRTAVLAGTAIVVSIGCTTEPQAPAGAPTVAPTQAANALAARASAQRVTADRATGRNANAKARAGGSSLDPRGRVNRAEIESHRRHHQDSCEPPSVAPQFATVGLPAMVAPRVVPVIYPGYAHRTEIESFYGKLPASAFWQATAEYGITSLAVSPTVVRSVPAPTTIDSTEIEAWIAQTLGSSAPELPAGDASTVYMLHYGPETTITLQGWNSCQQYGAYHGWVTLASGVIVSYAVIPSCSGYLGLDGINAITDAASHELLEAVTDPTTNTAYGGGGYWDPNWAGSGWAYTAEGYGDAELADACEFQPGVDVIEPDLGFMVQRFWSNKRAAAWQDPCVPASDAPYFNAEPLLGGTEPTPQYYVKGVTIPPGGQATIPVRLYSDKPTAAWTLSAREEPNPHLAPDPYNQLSFSFDRAKGKDGDVRYLTIKRSTLPAGVKPGFLRFAIVSTLNGVENVWWVAVGS